MLLCSPCPTCWLLIVLQCSGRLGVLVLIASPPPWLPHHLPRCPRWLVLVTSSPLLLSGRLTPLVLVLVLVLHLLVTIQLTNLGVRKYMCVYLWLVVKQNFVSMTTSHRSSFTNFTVIQWVDISCRNLIIVYMLHCRLSYRQYIHTTLL